MSKFYNRELSWLGFNYRILSEAKDKTIPLMERLKFLSITASNLDEFIMIRVASLKDMVHAKYTKKDIAGLTPKEQLTAISQGTHELVDAQYNTYNRSILPSLKRQGLKIITQYENLTKEQAEYVDHFFRQEVYPVLTPMAVDSSRPFPLIRNKTLNIAALLVDKKQKDTIDFATVQVPSVLPRVVHVPSETEGETAVILLEQVIEKNIQKLFLNYKVVSASPYRVMRNADLTIDEDEAADLLIEIEKQIKKRQWGEAIHLEVEAGIDKRLLRILKKELRISEEDIFRINGPLDLTFLMKVYGMEGYDHLKDTPFHPQPPRNLDLNRDLFEQIREGDIIVAGKNFGCGSSREQAPEIIKALGIRCVVAKSFARIFFRNSINNGLLLIENDKLQSDVKEGDEITVDINESIGCHGKQYPITSLPQNLVDILNAGGLVKAMQRRNGLI